MSLRITTRVATASAILLGIATCPLPAEAHLNSTGLGPIYDGALHLLLSPEDLVPAFAIALLAGLRGVRYARFALFVLPAAWLLGGLAGMAAVPSSSTAVTVTSFLLLGALVAVDAHLSLRMLTGLALLLGLVHGHLNGAGMDQSGDGAQALIGLAAVLFILMALVGAFVTQLRQQWGRIAIRVLGSWIAACGLLMLGWAVHRPR
jgi:hydrogenase/urease accessory protein HupE